MSGDHNRYQKPDYVDRRQWKYDPMTGEPLGAGREPEPVAWMYNGNLHEFDPSDWAEGEVIPLYTAPPQREWQGLTDKDIEDCLEMSIHGTCRAIEAKLKEKNG